MTPLPSSLFEQLDHLRRAQGNMIDAAGLGPLQAPHRELHREAGFALREYSPASTGSPVVLMVPAPIKRPYIWDLLPEASAVRRCLEGGARVLLVDWQPAPPEFGLAQFADRLILASLDAAGAERAVLLGHSLGGLFCAVFAGLHPQRVQGLGVLVAPLVFGTAAPAIASMVEHFSEQDFGAHLPGSALGMASAHAAPRAFHAERALDALLSAGDPQRLRTHWLVERWALDEFPLPRQLVSELATPLVRQNRLFDGTLEVSGRRVGPAEVAAPLLCVHDPLCELVPPSSVLPFVEAAASRNKTVLAYERDVGVGLQHLGPLIGRNAHARLWPKIVEWMASLP